MAVWSKKWHPIVCAYALSIAFWMPLSLLAGGQSYIMAREAHLHVELNSQLMVYAARYFAVALLTPLIFYAVSRYPVSSRGVRRVGAYVVGYVPFACAFAVIRWLLLPPWMEDTKWGPRSFDTLLELAYSTFADLLLLYLGIIVAAHAYTYFVRGQQQEMDRLRLRQSLAQSELQALRAQLQPHFLFNTLQGISTLIDTDPPTAQAMLHKLGSLLRAVLKHGSSDLISLKQELEFVRGYLDLEHMRLGTRLAVRWRLAPDAEAALIPQLLLQPLVENAIVHGIAPAREGGWIAIEANIRDDVLLVEIRNSVAAASQPGLQVGLVNVTARLKRLYADDAHFEFLMQGEAKVAVARLRVPALATPISDSGIESSLRDACIGN
ncbi:MAG: sensor histidine kinase [Steroidobacteraceae bacterium]